jgi:hypothetical protein
MEKEGGASMDIVTAARQAAAAWREARDEATHRPDEDCSVCDSLRQAAEDAMNQLEQAINEDDTREMTQESRVQP